MSARAARPARAFFILTYLFDVSFETTRRNVSANFLWRTSTHDAQKFIMFLLSVRASSMLGSHFAIIPVKCLGRISYPERLETILLCHK